MKFLLLTLYIITLGYSSASLQEIKIHDTIAKALFYKDNISVYVNDNELKNNIEQYSNVMISTTEENAQYIILSKKQNIFNTKALLFVTSYKLLKYYKNAIGAFYWKKGRPTIIFIKDRVERLGKIIPKSFYKFYEDEECLYNICF